MTSYNVDYIYLVLNREEPLYVKSYVPKVNVSNVNNVSKFNVASMLHMVNLVKNLSNKMNVVSANVNSIKHKIDVSDVNVVHVMNVVRNLDVVKNVVAVKVVRALENAVVANKADAVSVKLLSSVNHVAANMNDVRVNLVNMVLSDVKMISADVDSVNYVYNSKSVNLREIRNIKVSVAAMKSAIKNIKVIVSNSVVVMNRMLDYTTMILDNRGVSKKVVDLVDQLQVNIDRRVNY